MRTTTIETLSELIDEGHNVHLLTADLGFGILDKYRQRHPARFTNMGVAEANMVSVAAGMAMTGIRVFCYSMVPFVLMRAFEQVRMDLCINNLPVGLIGVGGGLSYGCEGPSHYAIEDFGICRSLPNLTIIAPGDPWEARAAVRYAVQAGGPVFIRLGKNNDPNVHESLPVAIDKALPICVGDGSLVVLAIGHILASVVQAVNILRAGGRQATLISIPMLKPFDDGSVRKAIVNARLVVTIEEHSVIGGLGSEVAEVLLSAGYRGKFLKIGLPDRYPTEVGRHEFLSKKYLLSPQELAERIAEQIDPPS